jgi:hypothetical protein
VQHWVHRARLCPDDGALIRASHQKRVGDDASVLLPVTVLYVIITSVSTVRFSLATQRVIFLHIRTGVLHYYAKANKRSCARSHSPTGCEFIKNKKSFPSHVQKKKIIVKLDLQGSKKFPPTYLVRLEVYTWAPGRNQSRHAASRIRGGCTYKLLDSSLTINWAPSP